MKKIHLLICHSQNGWPILERDGTSLFNAGRVAQAAVLHAVQNTRDRHRPRHQPQPQVSAGSLILRSSSIRCRHALIRWKTSRSVIISQKGGKIHFHGPIGALFQKVQVDKRIWLGLYNSFLNQRNCILIKNYLFYCFKQRFWSLQPSVWPARDPLLRRAERSVRAHQLQPLRHSRRRVHLHNWYWLCRKEVGTWH